MERERWREGEREMERWREGEERDGEKERKKEHRNYIRKKQNQKKGKN